MAPGRTSLFDLLGDPTVAWPSEVVHQHTGHVAAGDHPDPLTWLAALDESVLVRNVRTGASADRVAVEASLSIDPTAGFSGFPAGWPFVIGSMPDVEFRILPFADPTKSVRMFASTGDAGPELVLEGLPVEIRLPTGLVGPHPDIDGDPSGDLTVEVGEFEPGRLDDLMVFYRRTEPTSILVHVRLHVDADLEIDIQPAVPISFGPCALWVAPCAAVHDFRLIPSPTTALDHHEWLRHGVEPWLAGHTGAYDGLFSVRTVDLDERSTRLQDAVELLNSHSEDAHPAAELVLDDLVVPFHGPFWLPIPRHATTGIRRNVLDPANKEAVYAFDRAPVHLHLVRDPGLSLNVESLFYRSLQAEDQAEDLGLTFELALVWGEDTSPNNALAIELRDDYTLVAGYRRDFGADGSLDPGEPPERETNEILHIEVAGFVIADVMAFDLGFSVGRKLQGKTVMESVIATADFWVSMPPTGSSDTSFFRLRGLDGQKVAFPIEGLGWRFGGLHLEGVALPNGVVAYFGPLGFVFSEIGMVAEHGASYLSFSGGLLLKTPGGLSGGLTVKRLRVRMAGDESQPAWKLDGLFLRLAGGGVLLEADGYYTETEEGDTTATEYAFSGTVKFGVGGEDYSVGLDLLRGKRTSPSEQFSYFMFQAFYSGPIPIGAIELRSARVLYANDMMPKLRPVEGDSRELRYYKWYLESDPLTVPGDRRLTAWTPIEDAWALGIGASASFTALGKTVELDAFVLGFTGPEERGLLISARLFILGNTEPLGFLAIELDRENGRTSAVLGIDATLDKIRKDAPAWMNDLGALTGTLFLSNDPPTLAIGRLADQRTWLALRFEIDLFVEASIVFSVCLELVEDGPKGFGLVVRLDGLVGRKGVIALTFHAGFGMVVLVFTTGSTDYSVVMWVEAAIRFVLFGFLRIGVGARLEFRAIGGRPARAELTGEIRLETPWWAPDVTWRLDCEFGKLAPAELDTASAPIRTASAIEPGTLRRLPVHVERVDPSWDGVGVTSTLSVETLRSPTRAEAARLAAVAANEELRPVATDATITIEWSVPVNDRLGLTNGVATSAGDQVSGDLSLTYELVGIAVRRRARFGTDPSWKPLDERVELGADFGDAGGVQLDGEFAPQVLSKAWDLDVVADGGSVPKKLLVNGVAPFEFATANPEGDERLIRRFQTWPCCTTPNDDDLRGLFHRVTWRDVPLGADLGLPAAWTFTNSPSTLRFPRPAWAHAVGFGGLPAGTPVAGAEITQPGIVARADLSEDAAFCSVRMAWPRGATGTIVAFDGTGQEVGRRELGSGSGAFVTTLLGAQGPIRRLEVRAARPTEFGTAATTTQHVGTVVELDEVAYVGLRDYLDLLADRSACGGGGGGGGYEGRGKLGLLPNHEYELRFTTRVTVAHPSVPAESADVEEYVYVHTKGLPGLNAVTRVGEELDPYVRSAYAGGRAGLIYREEPVTLAFSEGFHVAVPLSSRPPGSTSEHTTLLRMQLLITPDVAITAGTAFTATADDWVVIHRGAGVPPRRGDLPWFAVASKGHDSPTPMISIEPIRKRLAGLTQRTGVPCGPGDPRQVVGTVLVAPPQGEPADPDDPTGAELWAGGARLVASVRGEGLGFVDRRPFADGDQTAFSRTGGPWTVVDGELRADGSGRQFAVFGEPDWDHLTLTVGIAAGAQSAGIGVAVAGASTTTRGLFATVDGTRLVVRRRDTDGGVLTEVGAADLPVTSDGEAVTMEVTAFDDRLRVSVGEAVVEVDRDELRAGRACLVADGPAAFRSLLVHGLDMYRFPVAVSRYRSFEDHMGSWSGHSAELGPDALGPGTTTDTVADLWSVTSADIAAAMSPGATPAERQRLFGAWVAGLGLALADDVTEVQVSRFVDAARTELVLIESPEPLDFTEEIVATMTRRTRTGGVRPVRPELVGPLDTLAARLERVASRPNRPEPPRQLPGIDETILDAEVVRKGLHLSLHSALANAGVLAVVRVTDGGSRLYRGRVRRGRTPRAAAALPAALVGPVPALPRRNAVGAAIRRAPVGTVLLATDDLGTLLGRFLLQPTEVDVDVPVTVIQSADARRAIVVRTGGAPFATGAHRVTLALLRRRWDTTDPADDLNTYAATAGLSLQL